MGRVPPALLTLALAAALGGSPAPGARAEDEPAPAERKRLTVEELERRLDGFKVTVDWKETSVLDGLNEIGLKAGFRFDFEPAFADFAGTRKVTFDGYSVTVREALRALQKAAGFTVTPDAEAGSYRLRGDPSYPTKVALDESKVSVAWKETPVPRALAELEKKTRLKIVLHETVKSRIKNRKLTWEAEAVPARSAIETLYVFPPPSVPARIDVQEGMRVLVVYVGPPETKADLEFMLDDRRLALSFAGAPLTEVASTLSERLSARCEVATDLRKSPPSVTYSGPGAPLRAVLDGCAKSAGVTWKLEGAKIVFRAAGKTP